MSQPYVGEIRIFAGNFAPAGWSFCDGSLLSIAANPTLFQLIGTTYGGDGTTTYALPDLRGRVSVGVGQGSQTSNYTIGEQIGVETVTLTTSQLAVHTHEFNPGASPGAETTNRPDNAYPAIGGYYATTPNSASPMPAATVSSVGGGQAHDNMGPFLTLSFIISLFGIFPSQS